MTCPCLYIGETKYQYRIRWYKLNNIQTNHNYDTKQYKSRIMNHHHNVNQAEINVIINIVLCHIFLYIMLCNIKLHNFIKQHNIK